MFFDVFLPLSGLYAVVAIFFIIRNRRAAAKLVRSEAYIEDFPNLHGSHKDFYQMVAAGKISSQMFSYVLSWILLGLVFCSLLSLLLRFDGGIVFLSLLLLIVLTPLTIIANAFWIYPKRIVEAEQWALFNGAASKTMKCQRLIAWIVWIFYSSIAIGINLFMLCNILFE